MAVSLLSTKLHAPRLRARRVERSLLLERLDRGLQCALTLVSAPAGFGKTTLVGAALARSKQPAAWLALDEEDNDPARFLSYLVAALQTVQAGLGQELQRALQSVAAGSAAAVPLLTGLINEIAETARPFVLVLDDYHVVVDPEVDEAARFLIEHAPPCLHVVIATRADPPWPLGRLRARGEMVELRAADLRFTPEETAQYLNDVMDLGLSLEQIAALDARTEGWIAGLQMAALSLQGRQDAAAFIREFGGSHRFILDYLVEEVLGRQPPALQDFLLKTSILDALAAPLCDAVTGGQDGRANLAHLEQANLFVVPLDDDRRWYRYHHLFADLLRSRLAQGQPGQLPLLHARASTWYQQNGFLAQAVTHAVACGDLDRLDALMQGGALLAISLGQAPSLWKWLAAQRPETLQARPWLCLAQAWGLVFAGRTDEVNALLEQAEQAHVPAAADRLAGQVAALRATVLNMDGETERAAAVLRTALDRMSAEDRELRVMAAASLVDALCAGGDLQGGLRAAHESVAISEASGDVHAAVDALGALAYIQVRQGHLTLASATCREALRRAGELYRTGGVPHPVGWPAHHALALIALERYELEDACHQAQEALARAEQWQWAEGTARSYELLALIRQALGEEEAAREALAAARRVAERLTPWHRTALDMREAWLHLAQGNLPAASRRAQECSLRPGDDIAFDRTGPHVILAEVWLAERRIAQAMALLERLQTGAESAGAEPLAVECLVLRALACEAQGDPGAASAAMQRALTLAEPEGLVRPFVAGGRKTEKLLRRFALGGGPFVNALLSLATRGQAGRVPAARPVTLVEPLSERELEVLRLLDTELSIPEIAEHLVVAPSTVRTHVKRIFGKLDAHSRDAVVARARELGLL